MSRQQMSKTKLKKYYIKKSFSNKLTLDVNLKGFLCTCNNREKDCIKEAYNLLNQYVDKLCQNTDKESSESEDIDDQLTKELSDLKQEKRTHRFQAVESGAKNILFIRTTLDNPVQLVETIVKDIHETGSQKTRFLLRLVPIEITCKANLEDIEKAFTSIVDKYFKLEPQTFSVIFNHRNNNVISREETIKLLAGKVLETRSDHKVDLKAANISIVVEIIKGFAFLSIIPNYLKYKKYNLLAICEQESAQVTD